MRPFEFWATRIQDGGSVTVIVYSDTQEAARARVDGCGVYRDIAAYEEP